jgi:hypothetical protein
MSHGSLRRFPFPVSSMKMRQIGYLFQVKALSAGHLKIADRFQSTAVKFVPKRVPPLLSACMTETDVNAFL